MERCITCGGERPCSDERPLPTGTIVEVRPSYAGDTRVGLAVVVPRMGTALTMRLRVVLITGARRGLMLAVPGSKYRVVHGYIHIRRAPIDVPCAPQMVQFVDAERRDYYY